MDATAEEEAHGGTINMPKKETDVERSPRPQVGVDEPAGVDGSAAWWSKSAEAFDDKGVVVYEGS
ncbi:hypothetical protein CMQ_5407 [Grosmannia clavigera kw1407]|uniref:Uncharacterized protein n=1 Tax=Grosmannia clavigera (strain kw1407 / UAMH 11150) TaxID=655863 RepID=F0XG16_GROCL|nr:uncharacterized protein CMQ_5407 [Grosmannia clavigera kw1407]EFX03357.1 hypothetical protein CMQ_5407 [Grosmannia clavigera kw1407]